MDETKTITPRRRGSLFGPLLLIVIGIIFLLRNMGALTGDVWDIVLRLWPVLLIVMGLDSIYKREGFVGATFLIGLGIVFLLSNFGYLGMGVWQLVLRLWPVLIIAVGFDMIFGRRSAWASLIGVFLIIAILIGVLWFGGLRATSGELLSGEQVSQSLEGASQARVELSFNAGSLRLEGMSSKGELISGNVMTGRGHRVTDDFNLSGNTAVYSLRDDAVAVFGYTQDTSDYTWDLKLNQEIPTDLQFNMGAGNAEINLSEMQISDLEVSMGAGKTVVTLPQEGSLDVKISGAVGELVIQVPQGSGVNVESDIALASIDVPEGYVKDDGNYSSPDYDSAGERINVDVNLAIGSVKVVEVP